MGSTAETSDLSFGMASARPHGSTLRVERDRGTSSRGPVDGTGKHRSDRASATSPLHFRYESEEISWRSHCGIPQCMARSKRRQDVSQAAIRPIRSSPDYLLRIDH